MNHSSTKNSLPTMHDSPMHDSPVHRVANDLKAYMDGELSPLQRWWIERHVKRCDTCRQEMALLRDLTTALRGIEQTLPSPRAQLRTRILATLPDSAPLRVARIKRASGASVSSWSLRQPALVATSLGALLLLMIGAYAGNQLATKRNHNGKNSITTPLSLNLTTIANKSNDAGPSGFSGIISQRGLDPFRPNTGHQELQNQSDVVNNINHNTNHNTNHNINHNTNHTTIGTQNQNNSASSVSDPISRAADISMASMSHKLEARKQIASTRVSTKTRQNRDADLTHIAAKPLVLAVADIPTAQKQVTELAGLSNGSVTVVSTKNAFRSNPSDSNPSDLNPVEPSDRTLLRVSVPASQQRAFTTSLGQLGMPVVASTTGSSSVPASTGAHAQRSSSGSVSQSVPRNNKARSDDGHTYFHAIEPPTNTAHFPGAPTASSASTVNGIPDTETVTFFIRLDKIAEKLNTKQ